MPSAKQQPSNIKVKHDVGIKPNVCKMTFGPPCSIAITVLKIHLEEFMTSCRFGDTLKVWTLSRADDSLVYTIIKLKYSNAFFKRYHKDSTYPNTIPLVTKNVV